MTDAGGRRSLGAALAAALRHLRLVGVLRLFETERRLVQRLLPLLLFFGLLTRLFLVLLRDLGLALLAVLIEPRRLLAQRFVLLRLLRAALLLGPGCDLFLLGRALLLFEALLLGSGQRLALKLGAFGIRLGVLLFGLALFFARVLECLQLFLGQRRRHRLMIRAHRLRRRGGLVRADRTAGQRSLRCGRRRRNNRLRLLLIRDRCGSRGGCRRGCRRLAICRVARRANIGVGPRHRLARRAEERLDD